MEAAFIESMQCTPIATLPPRGHETGFEIQIRWLSLPGREASREVTTLFQKERERKALFASRHIARSGGLCPCNDGGYSSK